ncbi:MAG: hypothetical protein DRI84_00310 [Bacteroidetes bacterium]|nr:MAG: hypothetical protein DRI84_00310 [Bacteroidota bacterium]
MKQILIILIVILNYSLIAQTPSWQWINVGGSNTNPTGNGMFTRTKQIGTDANGNIYGISSVSSAGIAIDTLQAVNGFGYDDFVVFSYTCEGKFRWMQQFGSYTYDGPGGIIVSPNGDVYVSGGVMVNYWGDAHFADSIIPATNNMYKGYFMAKLDSSGHLTHLNLPGPPGPTIGAAPMRLEADKDGNPVVLTWFSDSATWNGHHINGRGHYLVKFDKNCNLTDIVELDFKLNNGVSNYEWMEFTIDKDNSVYLYSSVPDTVFIGNDTLGINPNIQYHGIEFIAKINYINGQIVWHTDVIGHGVTDSAKFISGKPGLSGSKVFLEGITLSYNGSNFFGVPINNPIANDPWIRTKIFTSFDKNTGSFINATNLKSNENIVHAPIAIQNNSLVAGGPSQSGLIIMNINDTIKPNYNGPHNMGYPFVVSMDTSLTHFNWGIATKTVLPNTGLTPSYLHVDHNNNILLGGGLTGPIVNSYGDTTNLVASAENFCIAKIALTNDSCGCAVSVPSIAVVSSSGNTLIVKGSATNQADSLYIFWGDGDSTLYNTPNTDISHTYSNTGPWNVCLIAYGFCGIEDTCMNNLYSGIYPTENTIELMMNVYPNPFNDRLNIELTKSINNGEIYIFDMLGKQVYYNQFSGKQININTSELRKGFYFIKLSSSEGSVIVKKLVKN